MSDLKSAPFDKNAFMNNFQGMEDLAHETIKSFLSTLPALILAVDAAIRSNNATGLELSAHTLKGAISNFYAQPSMSLAWKLEQIGHAQVTTEADKILSEMKVELEGLRGALESLLKESKSA